MTGIAIAVWYKDGRIKYMLHNDQEQLKAHMERLKESISPAMWNVYLIAPNLEPGQFTFEAIKGEEQLDD